ncbi:MAG: beta strand repeat-containing protein, partial [Bacteroidota bacterium]
MKKATIIIFALIILFSLSALAAGNGGVIRGVTGFQTGKARVINLMDLPHLTKPYSGPKRVIDHEPEGGEEGEEANGVKMPPPDISELKNVTIDPTGPQGGNNGIQAPVQVGAGIQGISQGGYIPTEPSPAVGPYNIFTGGNSSVVVENRDGSNRVETDGLVFFGGPSSEGGISDLVCAYDARRGRFVAVAFTTDGSTYSHYYVAVSKTNDARGQWYTWQIDWRYEGTTLTAYWGDYEELGFSDDKFAISSQMFNASGSFIHNKLRVWDINQLYGGTVTTFQDFTGYGIFVTKPSRNLSAGTNIYLLASTTGGASNVTYETLSGSPGSASINSSNTLAVQTYGATAGSGHTPPSGSSFGLVYGGSTTVSVADNDCRMQNFVWRNGYLYAAFHFGMKITPDTVDAIRFLKINTSTTPWTLITDETFAAPATWYYFPSVTVDSVGTVFMGMDRSSRTEFPSSYVTGKRRNDATLQPSVLAKAGNTQLAATYTRWGDYTGSNMDETQSGPGGSYAWYAGQATLDANDAVNWLTQMNFPYSQIQGHVYLDLDANTATTNDRRPISGWTLSLKQGGSVLATTTSDANGNYNFGYLETGTYTVVLTQQAGNTIPLDVATGSGGNSQTKVDNLTMSISVTTGNTAQTSAGNDFLQQNQNASISGYIFNDLNGNGVWDAGEPPLSGWTFNLSGTSSGSTTSDATGFYTFLNLGLGSYTVSQVAQGGYIQSAPVSGSYSLTVTGASQQVPGQNFGDYISTVKTWTGGASTSNWSDAANWSPSGAPTSGNDVNLTGANTINIDVAAVCNNILLQNSSLVLTILSGQSLSVGGNFTMNSGTFNTANAFPTVTGTKTLSGGTVGYTALNGSQTVTAITYNNLVISGGGTKSLAGTTTINGALIVNGGTLNLAGVTYTLAGALTVANGATLQTGGSVISSLTNFTLGSTSTVAYTGGAENILTATYGNLSVSGSGTKTLASSLTVNGTLTLGQVIATGTKTLTLGSSGTVSATTGYVTGSFSKTVSGTGITTWEVGSSTNSTPLSMNVSAITGSGPVTITTVGNNPASIFAGDPTKAIAHYYTITVDPAITSITATPTLSFTLAEFNVLTGTSSDQTKLFLARWNGAAWASLRTTSTLSTTAGGSDGTETLSSGVSQFSPWAIFWGTTDAPLTTPGISGVKTWVGLGAGGSSNDLSIGTNWSPSGIPASTDSCYLNITVAASASLIIGADMNIGALNVSYHPTGTTEEDLLIQTAYNLTIQRTYVADCAGTGTGAHTVQLFPGVAAGGAGSVTVNGRVILGRSTVSPYLVYIKGLANTNSYWVFRGDSVVLGTRSVTSGVNFPLKYIFDGTGTQYLSNTSANTLTLATLQIGNVNTPTVVMTGTSNFGSINAAAPLGADLTISPGCTFDMGTRTLNRSAAGGTFTLGVGATLRLGTTTGGQSGSNFPTNFSTLAFSPTSTVEYYGTGAQTVYATPVYGNVTFTGVATRTAGAAITAKGNINIGTGATYAASTFTHNVGGNWNNSGTFTPSTSTIIMNGTSGQSILGSSTTSFNNLNATNSVAAITPTVNFNVSGTFTVAANAMISPSAGVVVNSGGAQGTITGAGTVQVTSITSAADFISQYKFTTNTLTGLTIDYDGAGAQTVTSTLGNYGALKTSGSGAKSLGGNIIVNGPLTIGTGTTLDATASNYTLTVPGAWNNNGSFTPQGGTVTLNGISSQAVGGTSSTTFNNLTLTNTVGAALGANATINGTLTLNSGVVTTGSNTLAIGSGGSVSRTTGYINGILQKYISTGAATPTFEIGDATNYCPVNLAFGNVSTGGNLTAKTIPVDHPNIATSTLNSSYDVNRYWTITSSGMVFDNYSATFNFVPGDVDGGSNPLNFGVEKYDSPTWTVPALGTVTATSAQATGMISFSDFAVGTILGGGDNPAPTISSLSPNGAHAGDPGFTLTVNGAGYIPLSVIAFRGVNYTTTYISANQVTASILAPAIAGGGVYNVTVFNPTPGGGTSAAAAFSDTNLVPTTTSISPTSANVAGSGYSVTVNGTNFDSSSVVKFNGSARTTTFINNTQVTAGILSSDLSAAGFYPITVFNPTPGGGTSNAQSDTAYNVIPSITSLAPSSVAGGGVAFTDTVNGSNFVSNSVVQFNGSARTTTFVNSGKIVALLTATDIQTPGSYPITVFNPTPGGGTSSAQNLTVTTPSGVTRTWFSATSGGDFNTASNWSPSGVPTVSDSCVFTMTGTATVTLSSNIAVKAISVSLNSSSARTFLIDPTNYTLDVKGITSEKFLTAGNTNSFIEIGNIGNTTTGTVIFEGNDSLGASGYTTNGIIGFVGNTNTQIIFKGNIYLGIRAATQNATYTFTYPGKYIFDGTGTQTITEANTAFAFNFYNLNIGNTNSPTVTVTGSGTLAGILGGLTINNSSILDLGTSRLNLAAPGGLINMVAGTRLKLAGSTGGQTGSNFPSNFDNFNFDPASTVEYNSAGGVSQTIYAGPAYGNLTLTQGSGSGGTTKTAGAGLTVNGNVTINANATFAGGTSLSHILGGNWVNNGAFSYTTANTMTFGGTTNQSIGGTSTTTFGNVTVNNQAGVTLGNSETVAGTLNLTSGSFAVNANTLTLSGPAIAGTLANFSTTSASSLIFGGSSASVIIPGNVPALTNLTINNASGVTLSNNLTIGGTLALTNGAFNIGANTLTLNGPNTTVTSGTLSTTSGSNLVFGGSSSSVSIPASATNIGSLSINNTNGVTLGATLTVNGSLTIGSGATLNTGSSNINSQGGWTNNGTFNAGSNIVNFNGSSAQVIGGTTSTAFNNMTINDASGVSLGTSESIGGALTLTTGTLGVGANTLSLNGPTIAGTPANLITTSSSSLSFGGSSAGVNVPGSVASLTNLTVNNTNGVTLNSSPAISGALTLTNGAINTGSNTLTANGTVSRTSGFVAGNFQKPVATGPTSITYEIGSGTSYTPVQIAFGSVSGGGNLTAKTTSGDHPNLSTSGLNGGKSVNRYWTLTNSGVTFDTYSATLNFVSGDVDAGATTANFLVGKYDSPNWSRPTIGTRTSTSTQASGMTNFSDFAIGEQQTYTITATASANGAISPSGSVVVNYGGNQLFTMTPNTGAHIDSVVVDGANQGAITSYPFSSVTANHAINAYFSLNKFTITSSAGANGTISPTPSVNVNYGDSTTFTFAPATGYHVDSLYIDNVPQSNKAK